MTKRKKIVGAIIGVVLLLCLLLRIPPVRDRVADVLDTTATKVSNVVTAVIFVVLGVALALLAAVASVPIIAVALGVAAIVSIGWGIYNWIRPPGQKPENVSLGEKM